MQKKKRESFKFVEIEGKRYRIGKFDALTGSYYVFQLTNFGMPKDKAAFLELQKDCLKVCMEMVGEIATPIMTADGRFATEDLASNTDLVLELTMTSLGFNVEGFFGEGVSAELEKAP